MKPYFHSVTLDKEKCLGCTNCIKRCPTEAIRVRDGKARIMDERCIDCGECIRICPQHAKLAITDSFERIKEYRYPVAIPAPTLYGQFPSHVSIDKIMNGLLQLGFARVWEVARGAEIISQVTRLFLEKNDIPKPILSSACPAVVRLIRVRYPELVDNILPLDSPMEAAAYLVKKEMKKEGYPISDVGVFFISPCAAKVTSVKTPLGKEDSNVDGVISIADIYGPLLSAIKKLEEVPTLQKASGSGISWAVSGGEAHLVDKEHYLAVDGIANVARVLEDIVMGKLKNIEFIEGLACVGGCVGGPLTVENPFMAKARIDARAQKYPGSLPELSPDIEWEDFIWTKRVKPTSILKLDEDMNLAIQKMESIDIIHKSLPGLDCGACGAPRCRVLAEDIVQGQADQIDCIFKLREKITELAEDMVELSSKLPPSFSEREKK